MILFIGDRRTRRFIKMLTVLTIEPKYNVDNILYVQDSSGVYYTLTFENHESLSNVMQQLYSDSRATAYADIECYREHEPYCNDDYDREIDPLEYDEIER